MNLITNDPLRGSFPVGDIHAITPVKKDDHFTPSQAGNIQPNNIVATSGVVLPQPLSVSNTRLDVQQQKEVDHLLESIKQKTEQATGLIAELAVKLTETSRLASLAISSFEEIEIELGKLTSELERNQTNLKLQDIHRARQQSLQKMDENQQKIKEAENSAKEAQKSGLFSKIFGWLSAIASIVIGAIMVATGVGAVAGALLIAGGVMGVVSQGLQQAAQDGLISKETMKWLGPVITAIEVTMAVAAAAVSFGGSAAGLIAKMGAKIGGKVAEVTAKVAAKAVEFSAKMAGTAANTAARGMKVATQVSDTAVDLANGAAQTANAAFQSKAANRQADVQLSRSELTTFQALMDKLKGDLFQMVESFQHVMELIFQMLNAKGDMINNLASRPQEI
ncbi:Secretion system effector C (SseC) like family protein [Photorhabdus australis subsp. thailandensis]|uniref:Secretion system effector C (SseC) like family protein n=1 Tax=Photorhabdus australis subsp. thailandensis TaxID=2805096 RepID=A0A1C0U9L4_9GAMM|nr:type III secretion system translocon subunit SctE [Photorhabdus australis]OCQ54621.1 Secretion system effector C (SseC) like family protein [Photorhabdus australis subsp. thailandensis]